MNNNKTTLPRFVQKSFDNTNELELIHTDESVRQINELFFCFILSNTF